ncbi:MAG TPA: EthD family reductase [Trebonia sp.]|nr:EthD family reductase [Trebonia sp.]
MHVLTVCYGQPQDPGAFDSYYTSTHAPLAKKLPGLTSFTYRHCASLDGSPPPYYLLAELAFPSGEALDAALSSAEGQAAAADVANFATGGATMFVAHD